MSSTPYPSGEPELAGLTLDSLPLGISVVDGQGRILRTNAAAARLLGLTPAEHEARTLDSPEWQLFRADGACVAATDLPGYRAFHEQIRIEEPEMGVLRPDGEMVWLNITAAPLGPDRVVITYGDITEVHRSKAILAAHGRLSKGAPGLSLEHLLRAALDETEVNDASCRILGHPQAELLEIKEALLEAEWKFRALFEKGPIGVAYHRMIYDPSGKPVDYLFLDANEKYIELTGVDPKGKRVTEAFPGIEKDPFDWIGTFGQVARSGESIRFEQYLEANDRWYDVVGYQYAPEHFVAAFLEITDQKRTEEALVAQSTALAAVIENNPMSIQILDSEGRTIHTNPAFMTTFGAVPPPSYCMFSDSTLAAQGMGPVFDRIRAGEVVYFPEIPYNVHDLFPEYPDFPVWIRALGFPILGADGQPERFVLVHEDVSQRRKAEQALRESEEQFRSYVDNAPFGIFVCDERGRYLQVNPAATVLTGYSREELLAAGIPDLLPPESVESAQRLFSELVQTGRAKGEIAFRRKNGQIGMWALESVRLSATRFMAMVIDISDRVRIEKEAQQKERYQRALLDNFPFAVWLKDTESRFLSVNSGFARVFGMNSPGEAVGKTDFDIAPRERAEGYRANDQMVMALRQNNVNEEEILTEGVGKWFETYKAPVVDDQGMLLGTVGFARDVTQQKQAEEVKARLQAQLQQSQKMESLGTLAGGVAHDMNNVLGAILGLASAHLDAQPPGSPLRLALDTIVKATERGGKMVKSLLNFSRQNPAENLELDLNALLREQAALLERTTLAKVRVQLDLEVGLRPVRGDAGALAHAFMNLCVNAVDAMPGNGTLILHTRNVDSDWIEVVVEDNGTGMAKEVLDKALDPFFTTKDIGKGTGLGLSMVFRTVTAHRGQMTLQSQPGQGTRVLLRFPACEKETPVAAAAERAEAVAPHGAIAVLLVDDDDLIQSSVQAILEVLGHMAVTTAQSGEEALALLETGYEPDLVILDMNMPGLGGVGTLPRLRALRPEVPVLLSTGRTDQTALNLAAVHPGVTLLPKPFGMKELQHHIESIGLG
jgi:PAS domain S-box-containing protein